VKNSTPVFRNCATATHSLIISVLELTVYHPLSVVIPGAMIGIEIAAASAEEVVVVALAVDSGVAAAGEAAAVDHSQVPH